METREGFGEHGNVTLFDDFPTVATVAEALGPEDPSRAAVPAVLDELAFCMKTATRLGRVVRIGDRWWGHPQTYGSRQMEVADEYERTGISPDDFDLWAILDQADLIALVALRTGLVSAMVDTIVSEFCRQVESFHVQGIHFRTPPREVGPADQILGELATHLDVLAVHDHLVTSATPWVTDEAAGPLSLLCRVAGGGWLVIELHVGSEDGATTTRISTLLDAVHTERAADDEPVTGLVLSDGYSQLFVERVMRDDRVVHRNLRALDLPRCRAQRWVIRDLQIDQPTGWVSVAADGRTVVGGGGPGFPTLAPFAPFEHIPLDWARQRLWSLPVGDRSTPGAQPTSGVREA